MRHQVRFYIKLQIKNGKPCSVIEKRAKDIITEKEGVIIEENNWGKRRLAYEINKRQYGNYFIINYEVSSDCLDELEKFFKLNQYVLRYLTIFLDKRTLKTINLDTERKRALEEKALEAAQNLTKNEEKDE